MFAKKLYYFLCRCYLASKARAHGLNCRGPILIFQMGKVGSSTVAKSLRSLDLGVPVYHMHVLADFEGVEERARASGLNPDETLKEIENGRALRAAIDDGKYKEWALISLVRDPVARNVSAFFHELGVTPYYREKYHRGDLSLELLRELFLTRWKDHETPSTWFDKQIKAVFGIDVLKDPFPVDVGYAVFRNAGAKLLLIRLENLERCVRDAMSDFLAIENFELRSENIGARKDYNEIYRAFLSEVELPEEYLDEVYGSVYCRHFYSGEEIENFRKRWTRGSKAGI